MLRLGIKAAAVLAILFGLLIPLSMIRGLVEERTRYRDDARNDIARSWTGVQTLIGPVLVIPSQDDSLFVLPETLDVKATLQTETRKRGLYSLPVYQARIEISGEFDLARIAGAGDAVLGVALADNRGLIRPPTLQWAGHEREFASGSMLPASGGGVHAVLGTVDPAHPGRYAFQMSLELRGMETLQFVPVGNDTRVRLDAAWPHPSFVGRFLPVAYDVNGDRFTSEWRVSGLATEAERSWRGKREGTVASLSSTFGVSLITPVDIYQQALRSVKYACLIVVLTFTAFLLVEVARRLMLHPVHYLLVGLALVLFFVLLLALSEHLDFGMAYLIAMIACVGLISAYAASILGSLANSAIVTLILGALYGMLYVILMSEDYALLMGCLLLFGALAAVMLVTRHVDWYGLGPRDPTPRPEP
jgi:inner membrane protein